MSALLDAPGDAPIGWADDGSYRFALPDELAATAPPETRGVARDAVRLLVAAADAPLRHARVRDLPALLAPGDLLVVNTSAVLPASLPARRDDGRGLLLHLSTPLPGGDEQRDWAVEPRRPHGAASRRLDDARRGERIDLPGGGQAVLLTGYPDAAAERSRLWRARLSLPGPLLAYLHAHGRPIRYGAADDDWPLEAYQTVFANVPGSAESPSAGRPFSTRLVTALVAAGVRLAPLVLHTGVSSGEDDEPPYPERYVVPAATAGAVNDTRRRGGRVVAVGTTVTRALETVADEHGVVRPGRGWTDVVVSPQRGVRAIDGLLTGWHEPRASHLRLLEAVAGRDLLDRSYRAALAEGYRWHEFGDLHLVLRRR
ncbi:MAG TPA: S-adenosylmethionine:tRNA ribosyltransferase-isomerase [Egibacteraceae bacterium]